MTERYCGNPNCRKVLVRRPDERMQDFRDRLTCNRTCRAVMMTGRAGHHNGGLEPRGNCPSCRMDQATELCDRGGRKMWLCRNCKALSDWQRQHYHPQLESLMRAVDPRASYWRCR